MTAGTARALCVAFLLIVPVPALANANLPGRVVRQPSSPVRIEECWAVPTADGYEVTALFHSWNAKTISAIRFEFVAYSAFDEDLNGLAHGDQSGPIWAHFGIKQAWDFFMPSWGDAAYIVCSVEKVKFADGTSWNSY